MSTGIQLQAFVGERVSLSVERVKEGARWRERRGHEEGFVAPSSKSVSNQRAQFNEAAFLVFSYPPFPSPQMALLFLWPPPLHSAFSPLRLSALFISAHFCFIFDGSLFAPTPSSLDCLTRIQYLCVPISPRWIIAQRTAQPMQVQIMSLPRGHCCLSRARPSKVLISVAALTDEHGSRHVIERETSAPYLSSCTGISIIVTLKVPYCTHSQIFFSGSNRAASHD